MARIPFEELPFTSRIWIFASDRPLELDEIRTIEGAVNDFLETWNAHGVALRGASEWRYERFVVVGVDEEAAPPSGCSIDALVRVFKEVEEEIGVRLLDRSLIWYRDEEGIRCVSRPRFGELAQKGEVGLQTTVFDCALTEMEDYRKGGWELPAERSWHARLIEAAVS